MRWRKCFRCGLIMTSKKYSCSLGLTQSKALSIFDTLKTCEGKECTETFTASKQFSRQRDSICIIVEFMVKAASADEDAAKLFIEELDKIIEE